MTDPPARCDLCGRPAEALDPLVPEAFYPGVQLHLHCLNSPAGRAWTAARAEADPLYARYLALGTLGHPVQCAGCGASESLSPKALGMGAGHWELCCTACHRYRPLLNAYRGAAERELYLQLAHLDQEFKLGRDPDGVLGQVALLAEQAQALLPPEPCACGGTYSLAAYPRCSRCHHPLLDSPFHFTLPPAARAPA